MNLEVDVDVKRKATVRISKKDLQKLLTENEKMAEQIATLQDQIERLKEENRILAHLTKPIIERVPPPPDDPLPFIDPNIYFDGAGGLNK